MFDPISYSLAKKKSKSVLPSSNQINDIYKFWFYIETKNLKVYHFEKQKWAIIKKYIGYEGFDNNLENGVWTNYISIPLSTPPTESIQYKIEINGDYINVYSNDGTKVISSGDGVLDFWGKVKFDGSDIRVFDESYEQNYFWIEEFDLYNQKCIIWVKLNAGQGQLNIAYGNTSCYKSSYNNGDITFEFFDDFNGSSLDTNKWTIYESPSINIANGVLSLSVANGKDGIYTNINLTQNYIITTKQRLSSGGEDSTVFIGNNPPGTGGYLFHKASYSNSKNEICQTWWVTTVLTETSYSWDNNWHIANHIIKSDGLELIIDGNMNLSWNGTVNENIAYLGIHQWTGCTWEYDYILVRKYISTDLSFGTPTIKEF